jgi:hypothetical protein
LEDEISDAENTLIAALNAFNDKSNSQPSITELVTAREDTDFPPLPPTIKNSAEDSKPAASNYYANLEEMNADPVDHNEFKKAFLVTYPPDWSLSPANNYIRPTSTDIDAIDSSLIIENERRLSLCLAPFSKEFYIATGYSKLQVPDDYLELIRVIIWHNRQRLKKGLPVLPPQEFEDFLHEEMAQDFSDLGIDIYDFLDDLIKIHNAEKLSFDIYNNNIKGKGIYLNNTAEQITSTASLKNQSITSKLADNSSPDKKQQATTLSPNKKFSASTMSPNIFPPTNLLKKFVSVSDTIASQSLVIDKPIILKNKETR